MSDDNRIGKASLPEGILSTLRTETLPSGAAALPLMFNPKDGKPVYDLRALKMWDAEFFEALAKQIRAAHGAADMAEGERAPQCEVCDDTGKVRPLQYPMGVREELPEEPCPKCAPAAAPSPGPRKLVSKGRLEPNPLEVVPAFRELEDPSCAPLTVPDDVLQGPCDPGALARVLRTGKLAPGLDHLLAAASSGPGPGCCTSCGLQWDGPPHVECATPRQHWEASDRAAASPEKREHVITGFADKTGSAHWCQYCRKPEADCAPGEACPGGAERAARPFGSIDSRDGFGLAGLAKAAERAEPERPDGCWPCTKLGHAQITSHHMKCAECREWFCSVHAKGHDCTPRGGKGSSDG